jgi:tetratricopeptide (TPR) repeat protein
MTLKQELSRHSKIFIGTKSARLLAPSLIVVVLSLGGCRVSSEQLEFSRAEKASERGDFDGALGHYQKVISARIKTPLAIKSAQEAARITHYELKRPKEAIDLYRHVILYSTDSAERVEAQKKLADLHFNQTLDYNQAILEYSRLLDLPHSNHEDLIYRLAIARSYFYLSNFFQARVEIDTIINRGADKDLIFDALLLKANIFLTTKQLDDAISTLKQIIAKYPERSRAETIGLILAVCYEEKKDFGKAIETLKSIQDFYPRRAFIEQKIKTLRERQSYLPGARGLRK